MRINKEKFPILDILRMSKEEFAEKKPLIYGGNTSNIIEKSDWSGIKNFFKAEIEQLGKILNSDSVDMVSATFMKNVFKNTSMYDKIDIRDALKNTNTAGVMMFNVYTGITFIYDYVDPSDSYFIAITDRNIVQCVGGRAKGKSWGVADSYSYHNVIDESEIISKAHNITYWQCLIEYTLLFKHYAKVETIHVKPKEKVRDPNSKEKHFNETDIPINILDCRWFNNIIRDEPFGVRGHFRLQPKKDETGKWIKEMIYIKPFIKSGYKSKARKLN